MNATFKKYLGNTSWMLSERVYRLGLSLVVTVLLARYLGPGLFGQLSYAISLVALLTFLNELGLNSIIVKELVDHPQRREAIKGTAFVMKLLGTGMMCALLVPISLALNHEAESNLYIGILAAGLFFQCFAVIDYEFQARGISKFTAISMIGQSSIGAILKIACIVLEAPLLWIVVVQLIESVVLAIGLTYFHYQKSGSMKLWTFDRGLAKKLLLASWPLMLSTAAVTVYMRIDQVMINTMLGSDAVGRYGAAVRIAEVIYFIPMIITSSLFPAIIAARKTPQYMQRLQNLYDFVVWLALLIALPIIFLSTFIIVTLFGEAYGSAGTVLMIHTCAAPFVYFGLARSKWIINEGLQRFILVFTLTGAVLNVLLNYLLIPEYGIEGAALASLVSQIISTVVTPLVFKETRIAVLMFVRSFNLPRVVREQIRYLP